jgi:oligopeptide/dipeptide ABC transporter ATP-binding protein
LFVAHDLAVVEHISHRVAVMYLGRIVEMTDKQSLFEMPLHPYTEALLSAVPIPKASARRRNRVILKGDVPSPINPPPGCHFHARCPYAMPRCKVEVPKLREVNPAAPSPPLPPRGGVTVSTETLLAFRAATPVARHDLLDRARPARSDHEHEKTRHWSGARPAKPTLAAADRAGRGCRRLKG